jgi:hypothetical protein
MTVKWETEHIIKDNVQKKRREETGEKENHKIRKKRKKARKLKILQSTKFMKIMKK